MDLSIVIVNYKSKSYLQKCLASIKRHTKNIAYEVIVIDNDKNNVGFSKGVNKGIKKAKGKNILLLNPDCEVTKGSIEKLLEFANSHPDAGAIVPKLLNKDGTGQGSIFRLPTILRAIRQYFFNEKGILDKYSLDKTNKVEAASMATFLITPQALKRVGKLNERYFMYFEDLDYARKLKNANLPIYYLPESKVIHHHGQSGKDLVNVDNQWRRLIPGSKIYNGTVKHYILQLIMWLGQKIGKFIPIILVTLLAIPAFFNLLRSGYFPMQDDLQAFRVHQMDRCFDDLQIPCRWVPDAGYQFGYPQFNFYPPLPYVLGALMHRVGIQYIDSVKILFISGYILSAVAMYIFISALVGSWAGVVAAVAYTYIPYKAVEVYVRGALSEFWAQIFFPLILWSLYILIKTGKHKYLIYLAFSAAFLAITHTLMTMVFVPIALILGGWWLWKNNWKNIVKVIYSGILGFGLSAFFILPVIFERKFVHTEGILSGYFDYRQHFVSLYKLFLSREWGYGSSGFPNEKLNLSLGIVQWVVAFGAVALAILRKKFTKLILLISALSLFSVFMIHMRSSFIWAKIPPLWYLQFPWRFLAISIFLICILVGFFVYFSGKFKYSIGLLVILTSIILNISYFVPKDWLNISDNEKFSGESWEKQLTISIFDYLPIYGVLPPWGKAPQLPEVLEGEVNFLDYKKGSNYQTGLAEAKVDSVIRIPLFDFPGMEVKVDGKKISHSNNDCRGERYCRGLITFGLPTGSHKIETRLRNTPIRSIGNSLTLVSLGIVVLLLLKSKGR